MVDQMDMFGNCVRMDEEGNLHELKQYKLDITTNKGKVYTVFSNGIDSEELLNEYISKNIKLLEKTYPKEKVKSIVISYRLKDIKEDYKFSEFVYLKTLDKLSKFRKL